MKKSLISKGLVIGIIVLFVGTGIVPAIGCSFANEQLFTANKINNGSISKDKVLSYHSFQNNLTVHVGTDKTVYKRFEPVEVTISVTNNGDEDWTRTFPYINMLADFDIGYGLYQYSHGQILFPMTVDVTIPSGETVELLKASWLVPLLLPPGEYTIRGWMYFGPFPTPPFGYSEPIKINRLIKNLVLSKFLVQVGASSFKLYE